MRDSTVQVIKKCSIIPKFSCKREPRRRCPVAVINGYNDRLSMRIILRHLFLAGILLVCSLAGANQSNAEREARPRLDSAALQAIANLPAVHGASPTAFEAISGKPVLVTFFASWCPPCKEEFAHLNKLQEKYDNTDLRILAINVYEAWDENDLPRMQKFINATRPQFPAVKGSEEIRNLFGGIDRIPTVLGFDSGGNQTYQFIHKRGAKKTNATFNELDTAAAELLARS